MGIYILLLVVCVTALFFKESKLGLIPLAMIFFVSAFRGESVGTDTYEYLYGMSRILYYDKFFSLSLFYKTQLEFISNGLYWICYLCNMHSFRMVIIAYSLITCISIYLISLKMKINLSRLVFFFYVGGLFIQSLNVCRQISAVMLLLYACTFIFDKKISKSMYFFVLWLLAIGIHASSVFFIFLYLFRYFSVSYKISLFIICPLTLLFWLTILSFSNILSHLDFFMYSDIFGRNFMKATSEVSLFGYAAMCLSFAINILCLSKISGKKMAFYSLAIFISAISFSLESVISRSMVIFFGAVDVFHSIVYKEKTDDFRYYTFYVYVPVLCYIFVQSVARNVQINQYVFCF